MNPDFIQYLNHSHNATLTMIAAMSLAVTSALLEALGKKGASIVFCIITLIFLSIFYVAETERDRVLEKLKQTYP
jgi:CRISPR/Cas system-associated endonuclease Cas1